MAENIPEVGKTYEHPDYGSVTVEAVQKRGRGYRVKFSGPSDAARHGVTQRLKTWQKAVR
jgi:hypothetical protein